MRTRNFILGNGRWGAAGTGFLLMFVGPGKQESLQIHQHKDELAFLIWWRSSNCFRHSSA